MLPGLSCGDNPPLAEPLQCVEGFNHLPEAIVLIRIFLILCTDRRSTIFTLGTPNRKSDHESFSFYPNSLSLLALPHVPAQTFVFRLSFWAPSPFLHLGTSPSIPLLILSLLRSALLSWVSGSVRVYGESQIKHDTSF